MEKLIRNDRYENTSKTNMPTVKKLSNITTKFTNQLKPITKSLKSDKMDEITPLQTNSHIDDNDEIITKKLETKSLKPIITSIRLVSKLKSKSKSKSNKKKEYEFKLRPDMSDKEKEKEAIYIKSLIKDLCNELSPKNVDINKFIILKYWKYVVKILLSLDIKMGLNSFKVLGDLHLEFDMYESAKSTFFFYVRILNINLYGLAINLLILFILSY